MNRNPSMAGLASLVQSRGRNGDSMLVHMTPGEVKGLHALALAHGGQLTINPDTGLYEANFLKKLLPTIIGFALAPLTAGTSLAFLGNPLVSGALVGGIEGLRTGDLGKGLMAGLGAFGGASLGAGLTAAAGSSAAANAASVGGTAGGAAAGFVPGGAQAAELAAQTAGTEAAKQGAMSTFGKGLQALGTQSGRSAFMGAVPGGMTGVAAGGMGLANALTPDYKMPDLSSSIDDSYYESGGYDPVTGTFREGRFRKGYPGFPPPGMAEGGVIPAPNGNYPLARPSNSVGGYEIDIDPYTGEERFAAGGAASGRRYEEMPADRQSLEPNSAKAGWMEYMRNNPEAQKPFLNAGYPAEFFQQDPNTFTGNRPFIPGIDESTRQSEQERLMKAGYSPSYFEQFKATNTSAGPTAAYGSSQQQTQQPQSLEAYYQSLLAPPVQQGGGGQDFANYMQGLNKFVTSPVAAPTPPAQQPPPAGVAPPGAGGRPIVGGGGYYGDGGMRWDATQGRFVADAPQGRPSGNDPFSAIGNIDLSNFGNIDFSALREYIGGMGGARGGNTVGPKAPFDRGVDDQFIDYVGDDMGIGAGAGDMGDMGGGGGLGFGRFGGGDGGLGQGPAVNPFAEGYTPLADTGLGDVAYAGGTPGFDMTGGMGGGMDEIAYAGGTPGFDMTGGGREYTPPPEFFSGPIMPMQPQMPELAQQPAPQQPAPDMSGFDFSSLAGLGSLGGMGGMSPQMPQAPQMPELAPQPASQQFAPDMGGFGMFGGGDGGLGFSGMTQPAPQPAPPPPDFSNVDPGLIPQALPESMQPGLSGEYVPPPDFFEAPIPSGIASLSATNPFTDMQQPAPQPAPDMSGFGGFGGGMDFSGLGGFDAGAMAPQPAPSYDMSAFGGFGGFGGMPQQPAPSFDMGGMGGGMDFGGGMDYSGMDFGSVGGFAGGGPIQYAAGGKFLRGPGDGMSDDIKANINGEQEARLADGEFVIPADVVSHIGNGSSEAGADRLYKMMADIRKARTGKTRQAPQVNVNKYLPA